MCVELPNAFFTVNEELYFKKCFLQQHGLFFSNTQNMMTPLMYL